MWSAPAPAACPAPRGTVEISGTCYIGSASALYVFRDDGRLVEKISGAAQPGTYIEAVGVNEKRITLKTAEGIYSSADGLRWKNENAQCIRSAQPQELTPHAQQEYAQALAPGLPLHKILQDFHSGRIFGRYGLLFMDLVGLCVMGLGLSGV
ncbi:MAG: hypothetical protein ACREUI_09480 [Burkholderiales bacterium]